MEKSTLEIPIKNLSEAISATKLENRLKTEQDIINVQVNYSTSKAIVDYDSSKLNRENILSKIVDFGFEINAHEHVFKVVLGMILSKKSKLEEILIKEKGIISYKISANQNIIKVLALPDLITQEKIITLINKTGVKVISDSNNIVQETTLIDFNEESKGKLLVYIQCVIAMILLGSGIPVAKIVTESFPTFFAICISFFLMSLVLLPFVVSNMGKIISFNKKQLFSIIKLVILGIVSSSITFLFGMKFLPGISGSVIIGLLPAAIGVGLVLFNKSVWTQNKMMSLLSMIAGLIVINLDSNRSFYRLTQFRHIEGTFFVLISVISLTIFILTGKKIVQRINPFNFAFLSGCMAAMFFLPIAMVQGLGLDMDLEKIKLKDWFSLFWLGAGTLGMGIMFLNSALCNVKKTISPIMMALIPLSGLVFSCILLDDKISEFQIAGLAVEFIALFFIIKDYQMEEAENKV